MKLLSLKNIWLFAVLAVVALTVSCTEEEKQREFSVKGVWELQQVMSPSGYVEEYRERDMTWLRIYDDSCYYQCRKATAPNGMMVDPQGIVTYTYIDKGGNEVLYLQNGNTQPLTIVDDSTMVIQEYGSKYTWHMCNNIDEERCREIVSAVKSDENNTDGASHRYVFSVAESELKTTNHALIYTLICIAVALFLIINYARNLYRNKKRVEQELAQIAQEREAMPEPVREAMESVEDDFHKSEFYTALRKKIISGERLHKEDWDAIETHFKSVYPRFSSTLLSLYNMSQVEYQVCLLLKLNTSPSEIANVICKDTSSISTIRSRLYQKVFGKKGSSKDWDEFIHTL